MSSSVESRIVTMKFDNALFERAASSTMSTLEKLKSAVTGLPNSTKGLSSLSDATRRFSLGGITDEISHVSAGFLSMATVGITALANITNRAVDAGINIAKSLTINPIIQGFGDYETKINAVQTILANTQAQGTKLPDVTRALAQLNTYANKTVYNFAEMAHNIGTFTAAGVDLNTSVSSIKGIANLAALSGSSSAQASSAMYQLSQAIAAGQVHLQDWNSVVNAGIGGAVFQKSLVRTGVAMGTISANAVKTSGPMHTLTVNGLAFRNSLTPKPGEKSWLTTDVLTKTLGQFTGDLSNAQLAAEGFSKAQIKAIQTQAKTANNAATQVKTLSQLMQALREEVATAWSNIFATLFGNINQAKKLFSPLHTILENALTKPIYAFNKVLEKWSKLGGRTKLIQALVNVFKALGRVLTPVKNAFRDIFPPTTGRDLYKLTKEFIQFTRHLSISKSVMKDIRSTFDGVFSVIAIGIDIIKNIIRYFATFIGLILQGIFPAAKGILDFTGNLGDMLTKLKVFLVDGGKIDGVFTKIIDGRAKLLGPLFISIGKVIGVVFKLLGKGLTWLFNVLGKLAPYIAKPFDWLAQGLNWVLDNLNKLAPYVHKVTTIFADGFKWLSDQVKKLQPDLDSVRSFAIKIYNVVKNWLTLKVGGAMSWISDHKDDFQAWATAAGNFVHSGFDKVVGWLSKIKPYAEDVGKLALALAALPFVAVGKLASALGPAMANVGGSLKKGLSSALSGVAGSAGNLLGKIDLGSIFNFGGGATSKAVGGIKSVGKELAKTSVIGDKVKAVWDKVAALFKSFVNDFLKPLGSAFGTVFSGIGDKIKQFFKGLSFQDVLALVNTGFFIAFYHMATQFVGSLKGLAKSASETLDAVTGNLKAMQQDVKSHAIMNIAIALGILAAAIFVISRIDTKQLGVALGAIAAMLGELLTALKLMDHSMNSAGAVKLLVLSASLILLATALAAMAGAIAILGRMKTKELVKGIAAVAAILALVIGASAILDKTGGAGKMVVAAGSILLLSIALTAMAGALKLYSSLDTKTLVSGALKAIGVMVGLGLAMQLFDGSILGALSMVIVAGALVVLAGALQIMGKMSWSEIGKAMVVLGGSLLILAIGVGAMTDAIVGAAALVLVAGALAVFVPVLGALGSMDWSTILKGLGALGLLFLTLGAAGLLLGPVTPFIALLAVSIGAIGVGMAAAGAGMMLFATGLGILAVSGAAGFAVLTAGITSLLEMLPLMVQQFGLALVAVAKVIRTAGPPLISALGVIVRSMLNQVRKNLPVFGRLMLQLIHTGLGVVRKAFPDFVRTGFAMIVAFLNGVKKNIGKITNLAIDIVFKFISTINKRMKQIADAGVRMIIRFITATANAIDKHHDQLNAAALRLGWAIVNGLIAGLHAGLQFVVKVAIGLAEAAINAAKARLRSKSPSREFMDIGMYVSQGFAIGIDKHSHLSKTAASNMANGALDVVRTSMSKLENNLPNHLEMRPSINPVLDLADLQREATKIGGMFNGHTVKTDVSFRNARHISADREAAYNADSNTTPQEVVKEITFQQNNHSPKALSSVEIWRNTRNQLSQAKEALGRL